MLGRRPEESDGQHGAGSAPLRESHLPSPERGHECGPPRRHDWSTCEACTAALAGQATDRTTPGQSYEWRPWAAPQRTRARISTWKTPNLTASELKLASQRTGLPGDSALTIPTGCIQRTYNRLLHRTKTESYFGRGPLAGRYGA